MKIMEIIIWITVILENSRLSENQNSSIINPPIDPITGDTLFTMYNPDGTGIYYMQASFPGDSLVNFTRRQRK